jgi:hypothetical protein
MAVELAAYRHHGAGSRRINESVYPLRRGVWSTGDLTKLGQDIRGQQVSRGEARKRLLQIVRSCLLADFHLTWSWRDPLPALYVFARMTRAVFRRMRG